MKHSHDHAYNETPPLTRTFVTDSGEPVVGAAFRLTHKGTNTPLQYSLIQGGPRLNKVHPLVTNDEGQIRAYPVNNQGMRLTCVDLAGRILYQEDTTTLENPEPIYLFSGAMRVAPEEVVTSDVDTDSDLAFTSASALGSALAAELDVAEAEAEAEGADAEQETTLPAVNDTGDTSTEQGHEQGPSEGENEEADEGSQEQGDSEDQGEGDPVLPADSTTESN